MAYESNCCTVSTNRFRTSSLLTSISRCADFGGPWHTLLIWPADLDLVVFGTSLQP